MPNRRLDCRVFKPATCLVESCRWGYSGCAYSPQQASCLSSLVGGVIVGVHM